MTEQIQFSHSRVGTFLDCKRKYKYSYIDKLKAFPNLDANNALFCGTAMHTGIEKDANEAIKEYINKYPIIDDLHINEIIKFEYLIPRAKEVFPKGIYEFKIDLPEFVGYIDLLVPIGTYEDEDTGEVFEVYDIYDFKYSNNISGYMTSGQLHEYKYYFEKMNPDKKIRNLYFGFIPKVNIKQKKTESLMQFRDRIRHELTKSDITIKEVIYDENKVLEFQEAMKKIQTCTDFPAEHCWLCDRFCEFRDYCKKGEDVEIMNLPKCERRNIEKINKKVIWLYGAPFSGKTYLANKFPDPLMLNTDGNIRFVDAPYIAIKDEVKVEGRITRRTLAWQIFKDTIAELEKKQNEFKTIVVDLIEDTYEHCRLYMYDKLGITHESDDSFRAWDKVRIEFLSTMKRLTNLDYENIILISHEDTSKDITKKTGDKITAIKPNLQDKAALKISGMVDIVARVIADDNGRTLSFKANDVIFGGGRLNITATEIPCDYDELMAVYDEVNNTKVEAKQPTPTKRAKKVEEPKVEAPKTLAEELVKTVEEEVHIKLDVTEETVAEVKNVVNDMVKAGFEVEAATPVEEEKPRTRRARTVETPIEEAPKVEAPKPGSLDSKVEEFKNLKRKERGEVVEKPAETPAQTVAEEPKEEATPIRRRRRTAE